MKPSDFVSTSGQKQDMSQSVLQTELTDAVNSGIVGRADKSEKSLKSPLYSVGKRSSTAVPPAPPSPPSPTAEKAKRPAPQMAGHPQKQSRKGRCRRIG